MILKHVRSDQLTSTARNTAFHLPDFKALSSSLEPR